MVHASFPQPQWGPNWRQSFKVNINSSRKQWQGETVETAGAGG